MGATLITVTSWTKLNGEYNSAATAITINPANIISVSLKATAYQTTGVTEILYNNGFNNDERQSTLIVTEAVAAIITAANANVAAA